MTNTSAFITSIVMIYFCNTQSCKNKRNLYFMLNPQADYVSKYKKLVNTSKFNAEITFKENCLVMKQMPYFYRYKDSVHTISKSEFFSQNYNILSYKKLSNLICSEGNDAAIIIKYNIYFVEKDANDKYVIFKVLYATPVPDDRNDNIIKSDSIVHH